MMVQTRKTFQKTGITDNFMKNICEKVLCHIAERQILRRTIYIRNRSYNKNATTALRNDIPFPFSDSPLSVC